MQGYLPGSDWIDLAAAAALSTSYVFSICPEADRRVTCPKSGSFWMVNLRFEPEHYGYRVCTPEKYAVPVT